MTPITQRAAAVHFEARSLGSVPVLMARPASGAPPWPAVLWFHGFGADAAGNQAELARIASAGFLAVGIDAVGHGRRRLPDLDERIAAPSEEALATMLELAAATADELPALLRALQATGLADVSLVSVVGVSMGGYIVYQALVVEPAIRVAVALLSSPEWPGGGGPSEHLGALGRASLLSITAERDVNVPPDAARRLHRALEQRAPGSRRHRYIELAGAEHLMNAEQWEQAMEETMRWLEGEARGA
jgi:pimeloyl-ACP methyl ester carboxylesterase